MTSLQQNLPSHAAHSGHVGSHKIWPNSLFLKPNYTIGTIMQVRSLTVSLIFSNKIDTKLKHILLFQKNPTWRPGRSAYGCVPRRENPL